MLLTTKLSQESHYHNVELRETEIKPLLDGEARNSIGVWIAPKPAATKPPLSLKEVDNKVSNDSRENVT